MTAELVAWAALAVGACGAAVTGIVIVGKHINRRAEAHEAERAAAATFDADFIAHPADVAGPDAEVDALLELAQIEDMLDGALATVRGWSA